MHRSIGPLVHGMIDYLLVIILAIGPRVSGFRGRQEALCYGLAALHLVLTVFTRFPLGVSKHVRFPIHGALEFMIGALMLIGPWLIGFSRGVLSRNFFMAIGALILVIWFLTDYRGLRSAGRAKAQETALP
jgi:hypothetical protein